MNRRQGRILRLLVSVGLLAVGIAALTSASSAATAGEVRVAVMSDCKGAFGFAQELGIGGSQTAFAQFAGGKAKNKKKPSAGMTGIKAGGKTKSGDAFYAKFVEFGTAAHAIKGRNGGWLSFGGLFAKSVQHPGMKPSPFMRPALDAKSGEAVVAVGNYITAKLPERAAMVSMQHSGSARYYSGRLTVRYDLVPPTHMSDFTPRGKTPHRS
jgi:HK97 gp10 family phage protein